MNDRIALLSNINMDYVIQLLKLEYDTLPAEGYGNEIGSLMDRQSSYYRFHPSVTFLIIDVMELIGHSAYEDLSEPFARMDTWFDNMENFLHEETIFYISNAVIIGQETELLDISVKDRIRDHWDSRLKTLSDENANVRIFDYASVVLNLGIKNAISFKMWYMGRMLLTVDAMRSVADEIRRVLNLDRTPKKVLALDLDGTLWGGCAGENDITPVELSDDHIGLAYKDGQRILKLMKEKGVILVIVSKNNEEDALSIITTHPHMILRDNDFAAKRINWQSKDKNLTEIAKELNLGLNSIVFFDDSAGERELVRTMLPEVCVPHFPSNAEKIPEALCRIYHEYFEKSYVSAEDRNKTAAYLQNAERNKLKKQAVSYEDYLRELDIVIRRADVTKNRQRILQLINKTNQFNLTTQRYTESEFQALLSADNIAAYAYHVADKFGDSGIVAVLVLKLDLAQRKAEIIEFAMSCRVMGRQIENAILDDVEGQLQDMEIENLVGIFIPTAKNKPVENLYHSLGYEDIGEGRFRLQLTANRKHHHFIANIQNEEEVKCAKK